MGQYDNYNPDIPYNRLPENPVEEPKTDGNRRTRRGKNKPQTSRKTTVSKQRESNGGVTIETIVEKTKKWANGSSLRLLSGIFLGCLGIYLIVCFLSYFSHCVHDQSLVDNNPIGYLPPVNNKGGEGGARLSELLINRSFGIGSIVIIVWLIAMSLKLLAGRPRFKSVNFAIKCLVTLITVSLIVGLMTIGFHSTVNWGGYHGRYVNEFIVGFSGWIGAVLLCIFMVACFIVICLRDVVNWLTRLRNERNERRRKEREEQEQLREKQRLREELRNQEEADAIASGEAIVDEDDVQYVEDSPVDFAGSEALYSSLPELDEIEESKDLDSGNDNIGDGTAENVAAGNSDSLNSEYEIPEKQEETATADSDKEDVGENMVVNVNSPSLMSSPLQQKAVGGPNAVPYKFPPFNLLKPGIENIEVDPEELQEQKDKIKKTLADYGIPIIDISATVGPTVTLYEIVPDRGVKSAKIRSLVEDIALRLAAVGVRIIAPIPGKGTVGIEVANRDPKVVSMQTVIKSRKFQETDYKLPIALGATINNDIYIADLTKMPHLLVAGATGQGKSVGLNAIITSLLYKCSPNELKFVLIDPKMVEFSIYNKIEKHYLAKIPSIENSIMTDLINDVVPTLNSLCVEMDARYNLLREGRARNIEEYNAKVLANKLNPEEGHKFLPYIVMIADEFADMLMVSGKEVELPIARLAQKARAVGIHVILATQRPSADVITGKIKTNFPARIAFRVSSGVDSKTILDTTGAQQLIGRGDMLISHNSDIIRVQCAFVDTPEVEEICNYIERQPFGVGPFLLPEPVDVGKSEGVQTGTNDLDPLFPEAARLVVTSNTASVSNLQRKFSIGYNRAGKIMDQLESYGIVSAQRDNKPRTVLMDSVNLETLLSNL